MLNGLRLLSTAFSDETPHRKKHQNSRPKCAATRQNGDRHIGTTGVGQQSGHNAHQCRCKQYDQQPHPAGCSPCSKGTAESAGHIAALLGSISAVRYAVATVYVPWSTFVAIRVRQALILAAALGRAARSHPIVASVVTVAMVALMLGNWAR